MSSDTYHRSENAEAYRKNASFVFSSEYTAPVLRLLDAQPADKILDLGCGSGELTMAIARILDANGCVTGQDISDDMIRQAKLDYEKQAKLLPDLGKARFVVQDSHDTPNMYDAESFDKVFSNAALHWMKRSPATVLSNVYAVLRPGGRFAAEMGGFMNCLGVRSHLHLALKRRNVDPDRLDPWFFPTPAEYTKLLQAAGFTVESCQLVPRLTPLPKHSGLNGWLKTFAGPFLNAISLQQERDEIVSEVQDALRPDAYDAETEVWSVMYVRLRVLAHKPEQAKGV